VLVPEHSEDGGELGGSVIPSLEPSTLAGVLGPFTIMGHFLVGHPSIAIAVAGIHVCHSLALIPGLLALVVVAPSLLIIGSSLLIIAPSLLVITPSLVIAPSILIATPSVLVLLIMVLGLFSPLTLHVAIASPLAILVVTVIASPLAFLIIIPGSSLSLSL